jgi:hypothetical protein
MDGGDGNGKREKKKGNGAACKRLYNAHQDISGSSQAQDLGDEKEKEDRKLRLEVEVVDLLEIGGRGLERWRRGVLADNGGKGDVRATCSTCRPWVRSWIPGFLDGESNLGRHTEVQLSLRAWAGPGASLGPSYWPVSVQRLSRGFAE